MPTTSYLAVFLLFIAVTASAHSQNLPTEKINLPAAFITCMIPDGNGGTYIGTEDDGIFHYTQTGNSKQYTTKDKLGDNNAYALSIDNQGRLWAGHLNSGISIFNSSTWKNYSILEGPIGERIFDIETCPTDDDVWIATSAGLTRYKINDDSWQHYTREDGLLEDQASALAFTTNGTLIVGTQCHGLAIFERDNNGHYQHAKNITAPERFGVNNVSPVPLDAMGEGLPSNQINDICIAQDGTIWIATSTGLAKMNEDMTNITYIRGKDYADKVRGLYGGAPKSWKECSKEAMQKLLPEDYLTCITEDCNGALWIGTRRCGFVVANPNTWESTIYDNKTAGSPDNYVTSILLSQNASPMIGTYGGGVVRLKDEIKSQVKEPRIATKAIAFPSPIKPPTAEDMKAMYYRITSAERKTNQPKIVALNDDWQSKGDWIDRIGRYAAVLCAQAGGGFNYFAGRNPPQIAGWIGRNFFEKDDALRHWVHWLESNDPRVLQCHALGGRKQAEWDDHKEVYPITLDGPHVYGTLPLYRGRYVMSFYFFNKDGHEGVNRYRDFQLTVKTFPISDFMFKKLCKEEMNIEKQFLETKEHARLRVNDFWGGVYKRFYVNVRDKECVHFQVNANYSFNTIVSGVFVDPVGDLPPRSSDQRHSPPRKPTDWAETLNNPEDAYWWWTINALDALLCVRDNDPARIYGELRQDVLTMVRATIRLENDQPKVAREIDSNDKELIRADVAKILHAASLHRYADLVDFTDTQYQHYRWLDRNRLGRDNTRNSRWDWKAFSEFNKENKDKQTW